MLRLRLLVRVREDSSFHCRQGRSLLAEGVMSQKRAERRGEKAERKGVKKAQGQATTSPISHTPFTQSHSFSYPAIRHSPTLSQAPSRFLRFFFLYHLTLVPCFLLSGFLSFPLYVQALSNQLESKRRPSQYGSFTRTMQHLAQK